MNRNQHPGLHDVRCGFPRGSRRLPGLAVAILVAGCAPRQPAPIRYGDDACAHCRMTIVDDRYAASLLTPKGRTLSFDAVECLVAYLNEHGMSAGARIVVADYASPGTMIDAVSARYLRSDKISSPMGGGLAAFAREDSCRAARRRYGGAMTGWTALLEQSKQ